MKNKGIVLFCILFMMFSFLPVHADMGPKSNIIIDVECDDENYYMALLVPYEQYGPHRSNPQNCEGISCRFYEQAQFHNYYLNNILSITVLDFPHLDLFRLSKLCRILQLSFLPPISSRKPC